MTEAWTVWEGHVVNDEFQLQKYLGGSEHSAVFLTERRGPEPLRAAIKLVPANEANARKYLFRWDLAARLSHPHLIRLLQQGRCRLGEEDLLYLVMEYAEENLAEVLPQRPLTPAEVRDLLEPTLDALSYLHGRGFVHGHLKPANVLAAKDKLKLASDGLCRPGAATPAAGEPNPYDPPEKAGGTTLPAADVWSLGMTLTEALTQSLPAWSEKETADPVVPETLPAPLLDIVRGCLRRDPERRLTIADIKARLRPSPPSPQKPAPLPQPRPVVEPQEELSKRSLAVPVIVVLAAIALFSGLGWLRRQPDAQPRNAAEKKESGQSETSSPAAGQRANSLAASSNAKPSPASRRRDAAPAAIRPAAPSLAASVQPATLDNPGLHKILPDVPQSAKETIQGTIRVGVKVHVDPYGNVAGAELDTPGPSRYFARLATEAAQNWKFAPAGQSAERQFVVHFDFTNTETRAWATQLP
jgi:TonB family protein